MKISRNLRNLKDAATSPNITFDTGGLKSLNLGFSWLAIPHSPLTLMMGGFTITLIERLLSDIVIPMGKWESGNQKS